ncbi:MAG: EamA family transporter [Oscillospiraceae bacterium]|nr:EamA family transporter [Oscillospiraceae bacterium]
MKKLAPFLVILAGCLWGTMGIFVRHLNAIGLQSMEIVEARSVLTAVGMFAALALFRRDLLKVRAKDLWIFVGGGMASVILFNYCYFQTIQRASLSTAAILLYTSPVFVLLLSVPLFGEKLTRKKLICLVLAITGCALASGVASGGMALSPMTLLLGLGSGFGYGLYSIFSRFALQRGYHPITITAYIFLFGALGGIPLTDFGQITQVVRADGGNLIYLMVYTLVTTIVPYISYTTGLQQVENGVAAVLACIEPVMATVFGIFVFSEMPTLSGWLGILLVLIALTALNLQPKKQHSEERL